jgi:hypothetical protein
MDQDDQCSRFKENKHTKNWKNHNVEIRIKKQYDSN